MEKENSLMLHIRNNALGKTLKKNAATAMWLNPENLYMTKWLTNKVYDIHIQMVATKELKDDFTKSKKIVLNFENLDVKVEAEYRPSFHRKVMPECIFSPVL